MGEATLAVRRGALVRVALGVKRLFDVVVCLLLAVVLSPLLALLSLLVRLTSPGPVLFLQGRIGYRGRPFTMVKFRTMTVSAGAHPPARWSPSDEARITRIGRVLRDYGLDELPQLFNIVKGDMSIVGPRPPLPEVAQAFTAREREMFAMRPGVISLAAVEGRRSITMERRIDLHIRYVQRWSLWLDVTLLAKALVVVLGRTNVDEISE